MKITAVETFVVSNGFTPPRAWHFCAVRTDAGLTGYADTCYMPDAVAGYV